MQIDEKDFKPTKSYLVGGIILIICAVITLIGFICIFPREVTGIFEFICFIILCIMFPGGLFGYCGILSIKVYKKSVRNLEKMITSYGAANIIENVKNNTITIIQAASCNPKTYFTDEFIFESGRAIIRYKEISWIHKNSSSQRRRWSMIFCLLDGTSYNLCHDVEQKEIDEIMQICRQKNPDIICGYSKEAKLMHQEKVGKYKI